MKLSGILDLVVKYLPSLISIAVGIFSWTSKAGAAKKEWVNETLKTVATGIAAASTGGQADK